MLEDVGSGKSSRAWAMPGQRAGRPAGPSAIRNGVVMHPSAGCFNVLKCFGGKLQKRNAAALWLAMGAM